MGIFGKAANLLLKRTSKTAREQLRHDTDEAIRHLMLGISADPMTLAYTVASGPEMFRAQFLREFRGFLVNREIADHVFRFFCQQCVVRFPSESVKQALARMEKDYKAPPTAEEIERSWVHEVWSSEDAKRKYIPGDMRDPGHKIIIHS